MVQLTRIYTRGGDNGETSLGDGRRVSKHHERVAAYGTVDEANATIGLCRLHTAVQDGSAAAGDTGALDALLAVIQNDLFDVGADLCVPEAAEGAGGHTPLRVTQAQVDRLEGAIDRYNAVLAPLRSFVLPGGTAAAAHLHLARTVTRRAEREVTALAAHEPVNPAVVKYLNRLSDLLFVVSRHANGDGAGDVLWVPGQHRT